MSGGTYDPRAATLRIGDAEPVPLEQVSRRPRMTWADLKPSQEERDAREQAAIAAAVEGVIP